MYFSSVTIHFLALIYLICLVIIVIYFLNRLKFSNFFIPSYPEYNELYVNQLQNEDLKNIKYLAILPNSDSFVSKSNLWNIIKNTEFNNIVPKSYILENKVDYQNFLANHTEKKLYILKKNIQNKKGLQLISGRKNYILNTYFSQNYVILQEFIRSNLNNKSFVIRIYILGIKRYNNNIDVFYHKYNKLLFSSKGELITNNTKNDKMRNIEDLERITKNKLDMNRILKGIKYIMESQNNSKLPNLIKYQLFGVDIICDNNFNCYLLEINKNPNMLNYFSRLERKEKMKIKKDMISLVKNAKLLGGYKKIL